MRDLFQNRPMTALRFSNRYHDVLHALCYNVSVSLSQLSYHKSEAFYIAYLLIFEPNKVIV